jgi:hypothetical protein
MNDLFSHLRSNHVLKKVFIVSKTKMKNHVCIGGILENGVSVRLLSSNKINQPIETNMSIGAYYLIDYEKKNQLQHPHVEDIVVNDHYYQGSSVDVYHELKSLLKHNKVITDSGNLLDIFESNIIWSRSGAGFLSANREVTNYSTCFWISNEPLYKLILNSNCYYENKTKTIKIKHVGFQNEVDIITTGSLVRLSLARWWAKDSSVDKRCYLQLSGWFNKRD